LTLTNFATAIKQTLPLFQMNTARLLVTQQTLLTISDETVAKANLL
jgi:hypothetical protein